MRARLASGLAASHKFWCDQYAGRFPKGATLRPCVSVQGHDRVSFVCPYLRSCGINDDEELERDKSFDVGDESEPSSGYES